MIWPLCTGLHTPHLHCSGSCYCLLIPDCWCWLNQKCPNDSEDFRNSVKILLRNWYSCNSSCVFIIAWGYEMLYLNTMNMNLLPFSNSGNRTAVAAKCQVTSWGSCSVYTPIDLYSGDSWLRSDLTWSGSRPRRELRRHHLHSEASLEAAPSPRPAAASPPS